MLGGAGPSDATPVMGDHLLHEIQEMGESQLSEESKATSAADAREDASFSNRALQDIFDAKLENCLFFIPLVDAVNCKPDEESYEFGRFDVRWSPSCHMKAAPTQYPIDCQSWLYVSEDRGQSMLYFESEENNENIPDRDQKRKESSFWCVDVSVPVEVLIRKLLCFCLM